MSADDDRPVEDRLRRALRARDAEIHPSADALARERRRPSGWRRRAPVLVAAAVLLLVGIVGAAVLLAEGDDDPPDVATGDTTTSTPATTGAPTTSEPPDSEPTTGPATTIPPLDRDPGPPLALAADGLVVWPRDSRSFLSAENAARSYLDEVVGDADPELTVEADGPVAWAMVTGRGEGGRLLDDAITELTLVETDGTWEIVEVESDRVALTRLRTTLGGIRVEGYGTGFEGTGVLTTTSFCEPDVTTTEIVGMGAGPVASPFVADIGYPDCPVVVVQLTDDPAANGATPAITSQAIRPTPPDIVVMRVDSDDMLMVRSGPGTANDVVATLGPFASGIQRPPSATVVVDGGDDWWEVTTPEGVTGWANAAFLSVQPELDEDDEAALRAAAVSLVEQLDVDGPPTSPTTTAPPPPPAASRLGVDVGGLGIYADAPTPFVRVDGAHLSRQSGTVYDWAPFPDEVFDCDPLECELTVGEFLGFEEGDRAAAEYVVGPVVYVDPPPESSFADTRFGVGLPDTYTERFAAVRIIIPPSAEGNLDWRTYTVVFDFRAVDPEIIAVWRWGWTP